MSCEKLQDLDVDAFLSDPSAQEWSDFRLHYPTCESCSEGVAQASAVEHLIEEAFAADAQHPEVSELVAFERSPEALSPERRAAVETHLAACEACLGELRSFRALDVAALVRAAAPPAAEPGGLRRAIRDWQARLAALIPVPQPALAFGVVAGLALLIGLALWRGPGPSPQPPSGSQLAQEAPEAVPGGEEKEVPSPIPTTRGIARAPVPETTPLEAEPARLAERPATPAPASQELEPEEPRTSVALVPTETPRGSGAGETAADAAPDADRIVLAMNQLGTPRYAVPPDVQLGMRLDEIVRVGGAASRPIALAPDHTGRTLEASPTLYWNISAPTPDPLQFILVDDRVVDPVLEVDVRAAEPGFQPVALSEYAVELEPGIVYQWFVVVPSELPGGGTLSGGAVERVIASAALTDRLERAEPAERAQILAEAGIWYDSLAELSRWIALRPADAGLRAQRAEFLSQVDLSVE